MYFYSQALGVKWERLLPDWCKKSFHVGDPQVCLSDIADLFVPIILAFC